MALRTKYSKKWDENKAELKANYHLGEVFNLFENVSNVQFHLFRSHNVCLSFFLLYNH
jgi:hypothetical protein